MLVVLFPDVMSGRWKDHEDTIGPKWKAIVEKIASLSAENIVFDPDLFDDDEFFWFTVDGVNFSSYEPRAKNPGAPKTMTINQILQVSAMKSLLLSA